MDENNNRISINNPSRPMIMDSVNSSNVPTGKCIIPVATGGARRKSAVVDTMDLLSVMREPSAIPLRNTTPDGPSNKNGQFENATELSKSQFDDAEEDLVPSNILSQLAGDTMASPSAQNEGPTPSIVRNHFAALSTTKSADVVADAREKRAKRTTNYTEAVIIKAESIIPQKDRGVSHDENIPFPSNLSPHDILFDPDAGVFLHTGNQFFRRLIRLKQNRYRLADLTEKRHLAIFVCDLVNNLSPPGRFMMLKPKIGRWIEMDATNTNKLVVMSLAVGVTGITWRQCSQDCGSTILTPKKRMSAQAQIYAKRSKQKLSNKTEEATKATPQKIEAPKFSQLLHAAGCDGSEEFSTPSSSRVVDYVKESTALPPHLVETRRPTPPQQFPQTNLVAMGAHLTRVDQVTGMYPAFLLGAHNPGVVLASVSLGGSSIIGEQPSILGGPLIGTRTNGCSFQYPSGLLLPPPAAQRAHSFVQMPARIPTTTTVQLMSAVPGKRASSVSRVAFQQPDTTCTPLSYRDSGQRFTVSLLHN